MGSLPFSLIQKRIFKTKMQTSLKLMLFSMCFSTLGAQVNKTEKSGHGYYLSGCPPPYYHYPHEENGYKTCAYYWNEEGDDWPVDACNGIKSYAREGDYNPTGSYFPMGSIYVQPGCTMYLYEDSNFGGTREEYYEGLVPNNQHFTSNGAVPGPKSFKCRCYYPINCVPEDGYEVILQYDNKKGKTPITLTYTKTIGISLSAEVQASFSVSNTKTSSISHRLWWRFSRTNTWSKTTTYDWSVKVAADFSVTTSLEAQITIQPGKTIQILQAVGKCGDSEVRTSLFKVKTLEGYKKYYG